MRSVLLKLDYINWSDAKGRRYWYYRRPGHQKIRIHGEPGSAEFLANYQRIHATFETPKKGPQAAKPGSLRAVIQDYKNDDKFSRNVPSTKRDYTRYLDLLETDYGHLPAATLHRPAIFAIRKKFRGKPRTANFVVQIISILMQHAMDMGLRETNPALKIEPLDGLYEHRAWEEQEIAAYRKRWLLGSVERTAFELGLNTGQRGIDIVAMESKHIGDDGMISVKQQKTGARVWIPISNDLKAALDAWNAGRDAWIKDRLNRKKPRPIPLDATRMILTGEKGRALTVGYFQHLMTYSFGGSEKRKKTGVEGLHSGMKNGGVTTHGLRFTAATRLRELGLAWDVIASITGHDTAEMVEHYTQLKRKSQLAIATLNAGTSAQRSNESDKPVPEK